MRRVFIHVILAVVVIGLIGGSAFAQKSRVRLVVPIYEENVPAAVLRAFRAAYPKAKAHAYFREEENGDLSYEIESTEGRLRRDVLYEADGSVRRIEEHITATDLPAGVQQTMQEKYSKLAITGIKRVVRADKIGYEVTAKQGKHQYRIDFDADGKLLAFREVMISVKIK